MLQNDSVDRFRESVPASPVLDPLDIDDLVEPELAFGRPPVAIERLTGDGGWKRIPFAAEPTGYVRLKDTVRAKNPTVYRWK